MTRIKIIFVGLGILISPGCGQIARGIVAPNSCKKCEVLDQFNNAVWSEDECGGGVHNMELRCKAAGYDFGCDHKCVCETYKQEPEE